MVALSWAQSFWSHEHINHQCSHIRPAQAVNDQTRKSLPDLAGIGVYRSTDMFKAPKSLSKCQSHLKCRPHTHCSVGRPDPASPAMIKMPTEHPFTLIPLIMVTSLHPHSTCHAYIYKITTQFPSHIATSSQWPPSSVTISGSECAPSL